MSEPDATLPRYRHALDEIPEAAIAHRVTATPATIGDRPALRLELSNDDPASARRGVDHVDAPTFLVVPVNFTDGTIAVDLRSRRNGKGLADSRAFAGIAYRIAPRFERFEAVYLRPLNGLKLNPEPPRDSRAVQHFSYPDWPFDKLREIYPDGRYEAGAGIGPDEWIRLRLEVHDRSCDVFVNEVLALRVERSLAEPVPGAVGLFVDTGTQADFADLVVEPARA